MTIEVYYFDNSNLKNTKSQIDYTQINNLNNINSYSYLEQSNVFEINTNNKIGKWYATKFVLENNLNNTINISGKSTLSLKEGILTYTTDRNTILPPIGDSQYYTPIYQSGIYLNKDVKIIREIVEVNENILTIFTIIY